MCDMYIQYEEFDIFFKARMANVLAPHFAFWQELETLRAASDDLLKNRDANPKDISTFCARVFVFENKFEASRAFLSFFANVVTDRTRHKLLPQSLAI